MPRRRTPIRGLPLVLGVAAACLAANAVAVAAIAPLSRDNLGPLALAYHDREPSPALVPLLVLLVLLAQRVHAVVRVPVLAFVGAAAANLASLAIWRAGVPDYVVIRRIDVITNAADLVIVLALMAVAYGVGRDLGRRRAARPRPPATARGR